MKKTNTNWNPVEDIIANYKDHETDPKQHFRYGKLECYELAITWKEDITQVLLAGFISKYAKLP